MHASNSVEQAARQYSERINYTPGDLTPNGGMRENHLFGSIHGMVNSMLRNPQPQENQILVEYSLGPGTTKVASCIPCSIFMSACGRPATSTHLGCGDSWNFPHPNPNLYKQMEAQQAHWGMSVIRHFDNGRRILQGVMHVYPALRELIDVEYGDNIPQLFLESLTFHGKFTEKIINTFTL